MTISVKKSIVAILVSVAVAVSMTAVAPAVALADSSSDILTTGKSTPAISSQKASKNGWKTVKGKKYYYKNGVKVKGWQKIGKAKYYFNKKTGAMKKGWLKVGKAKYYLSKKTGKMLTKWRTIGKAKYYFNAKNGKMYTGWKKIGKYKYYFNKKNGKLVTNKWVGNYFVNKKGQMVTNAWIGQKHVGANGKVDKTDTKRKAGNTIVADKKSGSLASTLTKEEKALKKVHAGLSDKEVKDYAAWLKKNGKSDTAAALSAWVEQKKVTSTVLINGEKKEITTIVGDMEVWPKGYTTHIYRIKVDSQYVYYLADRGTLANGFVLIADSDKDSRTYFFNNGIMVKSQWVEGIDTRSKVGVEKGIDYTYGEKLTKDSQYIVEWDDNVYTDEDGIKYTIGDYSFRAKRYIGNDGQPVCSSWVGKYHLNYYGDINKIDDTLEDNNVIISDRAYYRERARDYLKTQYGLEFATNKDLEDFCLANYTNEKYDSAARTKMKNVKIVIGNSK